MDPVEVIHESWSPIKSLLYQEPLNHLRNVILPDVTYYPKREEIFRAFKKPLSEVKVVIVGQDPYHGPNQANGLAFAVKEDIPVPPSLRVIQQEVFGHDPELLANVKKYQRSWRTLEHWEKQGVLLLNTALTVEAGKPTSHSEYWIEFTKRVVRFISMNHPCIWLLWGNKAQSFTANMVNVFKADRYSLELINDIPIHPDYNYVLQSPHPAVEVYGTHTGFYGNQHFLKVNSILAKQKKPPITW